jgi:hypothetical protein
MLKRVIRFMFDNIGNLCSLKKFRTPLFLRAEKYQ